MTQIRIPFLSFLKRFGQPEVLPHAWRWWIVGLAFLLYLGLFITLLPLVGHRASAVIAFPIIAAAWFFGFRAANIAFFSIVTFSFLIANLLVNFRFYVLLRHNLLTGLLLILASAAFVGRMSDLRRKALYDSQERQWTEQNLAANRSLAEALISTSSAINKALNQDELLDQILESAASVVPHTAANIMLIEGNTARVAKAHGYEGLCPPGYITTVQISVSDSFNLRYMAQTALPLAISNAFTDNRWTHVPSLSWIASYAGAPILVNSRVIGFLNLDSDIPDFYTQEHAERLMAFANQAAIAIRNARLFDQVQAKARQAALINEMTRSAISAPSLTEMAKEISDRIYNLFDAFGTYITLWDEVKQFPIPTAATGFMSENYPAMVLPPDEHTLTHMAVEAGHTISIADAGLVPGLSPTMRRRFPGHAMLLLPLMADQKPLGAAIIVYPIGRHITVEEEQLGDELRSQISLSIAKAQLLNSEHARLAEIGRTNQLLNALGRLAAKIATAGDLKSILEMLGEELHEIGISCLVGLREDEHADTFIQYFSGKADLPPEWQRFLQKFSFIATDFPLFSTVMENLQPVFLNDPIPFVHTALQRLNENARRTITGLIGFHAGTRTICLPLIADGKAVGVLTLWGDDLREADQPAAEIFSSQVAIAIQKAKLISAVQLMAVTDDLTGVLNRRGIIEIAHREVERSQRFHHPLSLLFIDLDLFKNVNDQYGHNIGDDVIRQIALRIKANLRDFDVVGRYGGDEFLVVLVESNLRTATEIAERLRRQITTTPVSTPAGEVEVSISIGVAQLDHPAVDLDALISEADRKLYKAKSLGRNRSVASISELN